MTALPVIQGWNLNELAIVAMEKTTQSLAHLMPIAHRHLNARHSTSSREMMHPAPDPHERERAEAELIIENKSSCVRFVSKLCCKKEAFG
jgi:hypothetical protein